MTSRALAAVSTGLVGLLFTACQDDVGVAPSAAAATTATVLPASTLSPAKRAARAARAVTGKPSGASTKPTGTLPKPATKVDPRVTAVKSEAADVETACTAEEEGLAACLGEYVVFCDVGKLYALDCSLFIDAVDNESGTCGEVDGAIDCGWQD